MNTEIALDQLRRALVTDDVTITALADGTGVILDMRGNHVLSLNPVGMFVVDRILAGESSREQILADVCARYEVPEGQAGADLQAFLAELGGRVLP